MPEHYEPKQRVWLIDGDELYYVEVVNIYEHRSLIELGQVDGVRMWEDVSYLSEDLSHNKWKLMRRLLRRVSSIAQKLAVELEGME